MPLKLFRVAPWLTIERLRTTVLIGGGGLVAAIAIFLVLGQWKLHRLVKDLPKRLGIDIQQQGDGFNYSQSRKGKTIFKMHASKEMQMSNGKVLLHDVRIDLYGDDGQRTDTISGSEFEYDRAASVAQAAGVVEITLMRPDVKPAVVADGAEFGSGTSATRTTPKGVAPNSTAREIHVRTSGLTFNQKTGVATTNNRVDFVLQQGNGSSTGATYTSSSGQLILDRNVELHVDREGDPVTVWAGYADFERNRDLCQMTQAHAQYSGGTVQTANALIHFRPDGSVTQLDGSGGVDLQTKTGGHMTAPRGTLEFDTQNHPQRGLLQGGTTMELTQPDRHIAGYAPTARLLFSGEGLLQQAHLEQGVTFDSRQQMVGAAGTKSEVHRTWKSQVADVAFVPTTTKPDIKNARGDKAVPPEDDKTRYSSNQRTSSQVEPRIVNGAGSVIVTSETVAKGGHDIASLTADSVQAELAPGGVLSSLEGTGHTHFDQRTPEGAHQSSSSDQLAVRFVAGQTRIQNETRHTMNSEMKEVKKVDSDRNASQIASMVQIGNVVLVQDPPVRTQKSEQQKTSTESPVSGSSVSSSSTRETGVQVQTSRESSIRATAARADFDGPSQLLHLTGSPRVRDGELDLTANQIDFARATGDAFAHGNVKASWASAQKSTAPSNGAHSVYPNDVHALPGLGLLSGGDSAPAAGGVPANASGPIHAIAGEAELRQATQEVTFRSSLQSSGNNSESAAEYSELPRLWQAGNSISAPVIVLNRLKQTLTAQAGGASNPVRTVLVSNCGTGALSGGSQKPSNGESANSRTPKQSGPTIIRLRSGDLHYSEGERIATLHASPLSSVTAETSGAGGVATVNSEQAEIKLLPVGIHPTPRIGKASNKVRSNLTDSSSGSGAGAETSSGSNSPGSGSSIDELIASGHVNVAWPDRKGTGEELVYLSDDGTFTLTGTSAVPPRITDQAQGTVTGSALIYHTRDDSVTVEGAGAKTRTDTQSPKRKSKTETRPPK